jgi:threonine aldolase
MVIPVAARLMRFVSDNTATASPEIMEAIAAANHGLEPAYGDDRWSKRLDRVFGEFFDTEVRVFTVATGTAANALALATVTPPYGAIFAHEEAHVMRDECGAPEFFSGGARVITIPGRHGKMSSEDFSRALASNPPTVHTVQPAAVTLTQASEFGTVYRTADIAALADVAHSQHLAVHMDGARFANAVVALGCHPAAMTWRAGVDLLSFGATKNGAIDAEAVVFFDLKRVADFEFRRKRAGHLLSKSRYAAAQLLAYIESGLWRRNAERSNQLARRIGAAGAERLLAPVEANEVFIRLGDENKRELRAAGFEFYDWGPERSGEARFVVSWDQPEEDVGALCAALELPSTPVSLR